MAKKKAKDKVKLKTKDKSKDNDRPGRKELAREVESLQAENEALRARLDRIAEIASAGDSPGIAPESPLALVAVEES